MSSPREALLRVIWDDANSLLSEAWIRSEIKRSNETPDAPYTDTGARFPLEASQFEVIDQRPFEEILAEYVPPDGAIENYSPQSGLPA